MAVKSIDIDDILSERRRREYERKEQERQDRELKDLAEQERRASTQIPVGNGRVYRG